MPAADLNKFRFREFRERAGLSPDDAAQQMGVSSPSVWDIETCENDLSECYSPSEVQRFCRVLGVRPSELFAVEISEPAVSAVELKGRIHEQCHVRGVTLEQFEDAVGWRLSECLEPPQRLLEDLTIEGLQLLCRELGIHWHRVILSL